MKQWLTCLVKSHSLRFLQKKTNEQTNNSNSNKTKNVLLVWCHLLGVVFWPFFTETSPQNLTGNNFNQITKWAISLPRILFLTARATTDYLVLLKKIKHLKLYSTLNFLDILQTNLRNKKGHSWFVAQCNPLFHINGKSYPFCRL